MIQYLLIIILFFIPIFSGCTGSATFSNPNASPSPGPSPTISAAPGVRAARIIFQDTSGGSFNAPSNSGTTPAPGSGLQATRIYNPNGTLLEGNGYSGPNWPAWLPSFEIGISGSSNTASSNPYCANFASSSESSSLNCNFGQGTLSPCGAPAGQYRVSEVDCTVGSPSAQNGNGGPSDGVYLRAQFSRNPSNLGPSENILVVIRYAASALDPGPANPTNCFSAAGATNNFTPENCSDFVWKAYLKHSATEVDQPFLLLIPPTFAAVLPAGQPTPVSAGTTLGSRQFILPLAADQNLTYLQISRVQSNFPNASNLQNYCAAGGALPGNSPLCAGVVFYDITFYRI